MKSVDNIITNKYVTVCKCCLTLKSEEGNYFPPDTLNLKIVNFQLMNFMRKEPLAIKSVRYKIPPSIYSHTRPIEGPAQEITKQLRKEYLV